MHGDIEFWRGDHIESAHALSLSVMRDDGTALLSWGAPDADIYPRSSIKIVQALPLVESGAADAFQLDERMLALACASHNGEPEHVALVADMLARAGLSEHDLECGTHWPVSPQAANDLATRHEKPSQLHNTCSGKHAGMLLSCRQLGFETKNYVAFDHPLQMMIRDMLHDLSGVTLEQAKTATDGCSVPTSMMPLAALAHMFAKIGSGAGLPPPRGAALRRLAHACASYPFYIAGSKKFDTAIMQSFGDRLFVKVGAEGIYVCAVPELKLGFALKAHDGGTRAAECAAANLIAALLPLSEGDKRVLAPLCEKTEFNARKAAIGKVKLSEAFAAALHGLKP